MIITISNQKGGVAKTTTSAALAAGLKQKGYTVLAIDLDPQGNLSDNVGADNREKPTIYELLKNQISIQDVIQHTEQFDIIPSNIMLAGLEKEIISDLGKEQRLKEVLANVNYDYIIIDTPPALGLLTINAFTACDEVIIPTTAGIFSASGITQLYDTIRNVKKYCNANIKINGILITKFNPRSNNNQDMKNLINKLGEYISAPVYKTFIRNSIVIEEAQTRKTDIFTYKKDSTVASDYLAFIDEYLKG